MESITKPKEVEAFYPTLDENWIEQLDQMDEVASENIWYLIKAFTGHKDFKPLTLKELIAFTINIYNVAYNKAAKEANIKRTYVPLCTLKELDWFINEMEVHHKEDVLWSTSRGS